MRHPPCRIILVCLLCSCSANESPVKCVRGPNSACLPPADSELDLLSIDRALQSSPDPLHATSPDKGDHYGLYWFFDSPSSSPSPSSSIDASTAIIPPPPPSYASQSISLTSSTSLSSTKSPIPSTSPRASISVSRSGVVSPSVATSPSVSHTAQPPSPTASPSITQDQFMIHSPAGAGAHSPTPSSSSRSIPCHPNPAPFSPSNGTSASTTGYGVAVALSLALGAIMSAGLLSLQFRQGGIALHVKAACSVDTITLQHSAVSVESASFPVTTQCSSRIDQCIQRLECGPAALVGGSLTISPRCSRLFGEWPSRIRPHLPAVTAVCACFLDVAFRMAAFSSPRAGWASSALAPLASFFHSFLLVLPHTWSLILIILTIIALTIMFYRIDRPALMGGPRLSINSVVPGDTGRPSITSVALKTSPVAWMLLGAGRLGTSVLFLPAMYVLLNTFVCATVGNGTGFVTSSCGSGLPCFGPLHWFLMIVCLFIIVAIFNGVWRVRVPAEHLVSFGLPHLLLLTIPVRLILAWSARILIFVSPSWSVMVSLWGNVALLCFLCVWLRTVGSSLCALWIRMLLVVVNCWCVFVGIASAGLLFKYSGSDSIANRDSAVVIIVIVIIITVMVSLWSARSSQVLKAMYTWCREGGSCLWRKSTDGPLISQPISPSATQADALLNHDAPGNRSVVCVPDSVASVPPSSSSSRSSFARLFQSLAGRGSHPVSSPPSSPQDSRAHVEVEDGLLSQPTVGSLTLKQRLAAWKAMLALQGNVSSSGNGTDVQCLSVTVPGPWRVDEEADSAPAESLESEDGVWVSGPPPLVLPWGQSFGSMSGAMMTGGSYWGKAGDSEPMPSTFGDWRSFLFHRVGTAGTDRTSLQSRLHYPGDTPVPVLETPLDVEAIEADADAPTPSPPQRKQPRRFPGRASLLMFLKTPTPSPGYRPSLSQTGGSLPVCFTPAVFQ